jgi:hypothetical protein
MTINKLIKDTLKPLGYDVSANKYEGSNDVYLLYNFVNDLPVVFTDNKAKINQIYIQVHLCCSNSFDYTELKSNITKNLINAGFSYPEITYLYDSDYKYNRIVFLCAIDEESED